MHALGDSQLVQLQRIGAAPVSSNGDPNLIGARGRGAEPHPPSGRSAEGKLVDPRARNGAARAVEKLHYCFRADEVDWPRYDFPRRGREGVGMCLANVDGARYRTAERQGVLGGAGAADNNKIAKQKPILIRATVSGCALAEFRCETLESNMREMATPAASSDFPASHQPVQSHRVVTTPRARACSWVEVLRFSRAVYVVDSPCFLVSAEHSFYPVFGRLWTQIGPKICLYVDAAKKSRSKGCCCSWQKRLPSRAERRTRHDLPCCHVAARSERA